MTIWVLVVLKRYHEAVNPQYTLPFISYSGLSTHIDSAKWYNFNISVRSLDVSPMNSDSPQCSPSKPKRRASSLLSVVSFPVVPIVGALSTGWAREVQTTSAIHTFSDTSSLQSYSSLPLNITSHNHWSSCRPELGYLAWNWIHAIPRKMFPHIHLLASHPWSKNSSQCWHWGFGLGAQRNDKLWAWRVDWRCAPKPKDSRRNHELSGRPYDT